MYSSLWLYWYVTLLTLCLAKEHAHAGQSDTSEANPDVAWLHDNGTHALFNSTVCRNGTIYANSASVSKSSYNTSAPYHLESCNVTYPAAEIIAQQESNDHVSVHGLRSLYNYGVVLVSKATTIMRVLVDAALIGGTDILKGFMYTALLEVANEMSECIANNDDAFEVIVAATIITIIGAAVYKSLPSSPSSPGTAVYKCSPSSPSSPGTAVYKCSPSSPSSPGAAVYKSLPSSPNSPSSPSSPSLPKTFVYCFKICDDWTDSNGQMYRYCVINQNSNPGTPCMINGVSNISLGIADTLKNNDPKGAAYVWLKVEDSSSTRTYVEWIRYNSGYLLSDSQRP